MHPRRYPTGQVQVIECLQHLLQKNDRSYETNETLISTILVPRFRSISCKKYFLRFLRLHFCHQLLLWNLANIFQRFLSYIPGKQYWQVQGLNMPILAQLFKLFDFDTIILHRTLYFFMMLVLIQLYILQALIMSHIFIDYKLVDIKVDLIALQADFSPIIFNSVIQVFSKILEAIFQVSVKLMHLSHLLSPMPFFRKFITKQPLNIVHLQNVREKHLEDLLLCIICFIHSLRNQKFFRRFSQNKLIFVFENCCDFEFEIFKICCLFKYVKFGDKALFSFHKTILRRHLFILRSIELSISRFLHLQQRLLLFLFLFRRAEMISKLSFENSIEQFFSAITRQF